MSITLKWMWYVFQKDKLSQIKNQVSTKDNILILRHDLTLDQTTNIAEKAELNKKHNNGNISILNKKTN